MSRSNKWSLEWSFFIGEHGRRKYNKKCNRCIHDCKQSFRAIIVECPKYDRTPQKNVQINDDIKEKPYLF